jgi:hypothetical protein
MDTLIENRYRYAIMWGGDNAHNWSSRTQIMVGSKEQAMLHNLPSMNFMSEVKSPWLSSAVHLLSLRREQPS